MSRKYGEWSIAFFRGAVDGAKEELEELRRLNVVIETKIERFEARIAQFDKLVIALEGEAKGNG